MDVPDKLELSDELYNALMDDIVAGTGGDVAAVIAEIRRLGLDRPGVGAPLEPDD